MPAGALWLELVRDSLLLTAVLIYIRVREVVILSSDTLITTFDTFLIISGILSLSTAVFIASTEVVISVIVFIFDRWSIILDRVLSVMLRELGYRTVISAILTGRSRQRRVCTLLLINHPL